MTWQEDLHLYVELHKKIIELESRAKECTCDYSNFHRCDLCAEINDKHTEQLRLMDIWGRLWALKLYRVAQGIEPVTPVHFEKEQPCQESTS